MHRTNWDDLRYVLAVADAGSVAGAARKLRVNHATVLRRVAQFEESHGVTVFDKAASGYAVTPEARNIVDAIRETDHAVFAVERLAREGSRSVHGDVRITSTDTLCAFILPQVVENVSKIERELRLEVLSSNAYTDLSQSIADIAIRPTPALPDDLFGQSAGVLTFQLYRRKDAAADQTGWLGLRGDLSRSKPALWMASNVEEADVVTSADSFLTLRELAVAGLGQTFLPSFVGDRSPELTCVAGIPEMNVPLWVASHQSLMNTPRISRVRDLLANLLSHEPALLSQV